MFFNVFKQTFTCYNTWRLAQIDIIYPSASRPPRPDATRTACEPHTAAMFCSKTERKEGKHSANQASSRSNCHHSKNMMHAGCTLVFSLFANIHTVQRVKIGIPNIALWDSGSPRIKHQTLPIVPSSHLAVNRELFSWQNIPNISDDFDSQHKNGSMTGEMTMHELHWLLASRISLFVLTNRSYKRRFSRLGFPHVRRRGTVPQVCQDSVSHLLDRLWTVYSDDLPCLRIYCWV